MTGAGEHTWQLENARQLDCAAVALERCLEAHISGAVAAHAAFGDADATPLALEVVSRRFSLRANERDVLLLCHLLDRHGRLAELAARVRRDPAARHASFELAAMLWPALGRAVLSPAGALRRWRLLDLALGQPFGVAPLSVDERIQFYLEGHNALDVRLEGMIRPIGAVPRRDEAFDTRVSDALRATPLQRLPAVELTGARVSDCTGVVASVAPQLGLAPYVLLATDIPQQPGEREALARLWEREAMLLDAALLIDASDATRDCHARLGMFLETVEAVVFIATRTPLPRLQRPVVTVELARRAPREEVARWRAKLGRAAEQMNGGLERAASQFRLDDAALSIVADAARRASSAEQAAETIWDSARLQTRRGFDGLAERIDARAGWRDLILPDSQLAVLRAITTHVRARHRVHEEWGFAHRNACGLGIAALFCGGSGTGKTLAAEVLADTLRLDLYRVDLARVVSKYIGETEKNLATVFDAAEASGAILLFDEADAVFGKRSEVRDSHDRYANIEVSYLLQRIEAYTGLAILTTNQKQAIDAAFMRRIRFVVHFPFPDASARQAIWERVFPVAVPRTRLDVGKLARLNLSGGHIRNIALNAAFLAADRNEPVGMPHLRDAAEAEYVKLERPLPRADLGDWT